MGFSHIIHSEENLFGDIEVAHYIPAYSMMITVDGDNRCVAWSGDAPFYRKALKQVRRVFKECEKELKKKKQLWGKKKNK